MSRLFFLLLLLLLVLILLLFAKRFRSKRPITRRRARFVLINQIARLLVGIRCLANESENYPSLVLFFLFFQTDTYFPREYELRKRFCARDVILKTREGIITNSKRRKKFNSTLQYRDAVAV